MKKVRFTVVLILLLASAGIAFAAGTAETTAAPQQKVKITVWGPLENYSEAEKLSWNFCVEEFKKRNPDIEIESIFSPAGTDYRQQYDKALMAGEAPTVTNLLPYVDVQTRAANGMIADISDFVDNWDLKKQGIVNPAMDEALQYNGKWYGVMDYVYLAGTVYNKTALKAGGGDVSKLPKTWDEFTSLGQKITDLKTPRFGYLLLGMEWNAWPFTPWVWSAGGEMVIPNGNGTYKVGFSEEPGVDAAMLWHDMIWKYHMTQKDVLKSWNDLRDDMHSGRGVFAFGRMDHYASDAEKKYGIPQSTFGIIPIPAKDASQKQVSIAGGNAWIFSPTATPAELDAAWKFVQLFDYDKDFQIKKWEYENSIGGINNRIPPRVDIIDTKFSMATSWPEGWAEEFSVISATARMEPWCPNWNNLKNILAPVLQKILLTENISRNEVRDLLTQAANEAYKMYPDTFRK
ncbi:ABC-type sugar transport system, periplasmic component [Sphaerochaeta pleomorpha str. Grapes]|uniref:ABC-type sugar transport system, periplasmic component n=1 Tax=Sphaerochaeta pleomorpha (strain ATCC BAA-1885 / DSM 22778 / Grapes) TaxID=158190 RepID=G8QWD0_SPHPG|nr:extracellular solute-binding protein [Sphaerochaeta pleomorpha]AEV29428.1 ABC-type sugar transport system, periplasmic component [Sphaerochaeta pleomorpha str. Grapes]